MNTIRGNATAFTANGRFGIVTVEKILDGHCKITVTRQATFEREKSTHLCVLVCACACAYECET